MAQGTRITVDDLVSAMAMLSMTSDEPLGFIEDWLPLGRGGQRRLFNSCDEYFREYAVWLSMGAIAKEEHLRAREAASA